MLNLMLQKLIEELYPDYTVYYYLDGTNNKIIVKVTHYFFSATQSIELKELEPFDNLFPLSPYNEGVIVRTIRKTKSLVDQEKRKRGFVI